MISINFLSLCFWGVLAAYIIHIVDETLMGGGFTEKVKERYGLRPGLIGRTDFLIGMTGGFIGALFLAFLPTTIMPRISKRKQARPDQR
jgi:hypothetical protein